MVQPSPQFSAAAQLVDAGRPEGRTQMEALARAKDPFGMFEMARLELMQPEAERDLKRIFGYLSGASDAGIVEAERARLYFVNAGLGTKAEPSKARELLGDLAKKDRFSAVQMQILERMTCRHKLKEIKPQIVKDDPYVAVYSGLFSDMEVRYLQQLGSPRMRPAMIADPRTGQGVLDPIRKSDTMAFGEFITDLVVQEVLQTIADATDTNVSQGEHLSIIRYVPGQEYRPHYDSYDRGDPRPQRAYTALIWLNKEFEGGETAFPNINVTIRGMPGDLLVFGNLDEHGERDERMLHAGLPVTRGEKWIASRWIRAA